MNLQKSCSYFSFHFTFFFFCYDTCGLSLSYRLTQFWGLSTFFCCNYFIELAVSVLGWKSFIRGKIGAEILPIHPGSRPSGARAEFHFLYHYYANFQLTLRNLFSNIISCLFITYRPARYGCRNSKGFNCIFDILYMLRVFFDTLPYFQITQVCPFIYLFLDQPLWVHCVYALSTVALRVLSH